ncbi:hypothetical protein IMG5_162750 [Ichthyophthirius multifiliis]|uniref:RRM domain-containing protein n=1 Tax=Ichthyophthirius multifiliis TaxID=5932 RepID=G0R093_ICHMU|nr:hypothetical protein IMG5_162750 [Ichthyophthirius multifiliis]EGR29101.1 hypothetical protein IMG5_162750 [Ichthyophthirius multifiliis]|eukprot:XP_004030337.1 hypothetical protein IMG5_162750 [Ichthyophthirius multifiliis]
MPYKIIYEEKELKYRREKLQKMYEIIDKYINKWKKTLLVFDIMIFIPQKYVKDAKNYYLQKIMEKINIIDGQKDDNYKMRKFNIFLIQDVYDLVIWQKNIKNIHLQIDFGEKSQVFYPQEGFFQQNPHFYSFLSQKQAFQRQKVLSQVQKGIIHRLYTKDQFFGFLKDIKKQLIQEKNQEEDDSSNQERYHFRIVNKFIQVFMEEKKSWFKCKSQVSAHTCVFWNRKGDLYTIWQCFLQKKAIFEEFQGYQWMNQEEKLNESEKEWADFCRRNQVRKNVIDQMEEKIDKDCICIKIEDFDLIVQEVLVKKYYKNLCVYTGNRKKGYQHFESRQNFLYCNEKSAFKLIEEHPFLIIPISFIQKEKVYLGSCVQIDHKNLIQFAPFEFLEKHNLRLIKSQSLNLAEIEFFGISNVLMRYLPSIVKKIEDKFGCLCEVNFLGESVILSCDQNLKEKIENEFRILIDECKFQLKNEILDIPAGKKSMAKIGKGGLVQNIHVFENEHVFLVEGLPLDVNVQEIKDFFQLENLDEIIDVKYFQNQGKAEVLVADSQDASIYVKSFNQTLFKGNTIRLKLNSHDFIIHDQDIKNLQYMKIKWNQWKSKRTAIITFNSKENIKQFSDLVQNQLMIDYSIIEIEKINENKTVKIKNLQPITDEKSIIKVLKKNNLLGYSNIEVERFPDVDRDFLKQVLIDKLDLVYKQGANHDIQYIKKKIKVLIKYLMMPQRLLIIYFNQNFLILENKIKQFFILFIKNYQLKKNIKDAYCIII